MSDDEDETPTTNTTFTDEFLLKIPKTDLHCHLDGSIRVQTLVDLSREQNLPLPSFDVDELNKSLFQDSYGSLEEYLECFQYTTACLREYNALERVSYEFAVDQFTVGVRYFECRFAPQLNAVPGKLSLEDVMLAVNHGLKRARDEWNALPQIVEGKEPEYDYGIIVCAMRFFLPVFSPYYQMFWDMHPHEDPHVIYGLASKSLITTAHFLKQQKESEGEELPIVALDIAGAEGGFPAEDHADAYNFCVKKFINKTVHAGEGYGPESIFQAITDLHAERIGHGVHLFSPNLVKSEKNQQDAEAYVKHLTEYIARNRVCLEVCLSSNLQTLPELGSISNHPFKKMLENRLAVTICTDNCTVSKTSIVQELRLAADAFNLTPYQMKDVVIHGFKRSFMDRPYKEKRKYNHAIIAYYDKIAKEHGVTISPNY